MLLFSPPTVTPPVASAFAERLCRGVPLGAPNKRIGPSPHATNHKMNGDA